MLSFIFQYGSLWRRALALAVDILVLTCVGVFLLDPLSIALGYQSLHAATLHAPVSVDIVRGYGVWTVAMLVIAWLYFAVMESSQKQGTFGKRLLGIMVFSHEEGRLTFGQASLRFWIKLLTIGTGFLGFFFALWDSKSRTLHDRVAGSVVLQGRPEVLGDFKEA